MGGYGAVITAGGGVTPESVQFGFSPPFGTLGIHESGSDSHNSLPDPRIKTAIAFAPWGRNSGFFNAQSLAGIQIPMLFIAGSKDDVSLYEGGVRSIWEEAVNVDRALLTFDNANHNAGAPFPAPEESFEFNANLGFAYLDLIPNSNDGVFSLAEDGTFSTDHTYWKGFANRTALGLRFEWLRTGDGSQ